MDTPVVIFCVCLPVRVCVRASECGLCSLGVWQQGQYRQNQSDSTVSSFHVNALSLSLSRSLSLSLSIYLSLCVCVCVCVCLSVCLSVSVRCVTVILRLSAEFPGKLTGLQRERRDIKADTKHQQRLHHSAVHWWNRGWNWSGSYTHWLLHFPSFRVVWGSTLKSSAGHPPFRAPVSWQKNVTGWSKCIHMFTDDFENTLFQLFTSQQLTSMSICLSLLFSSTQIPPPNIVNHCAVWCYTNAFWHPTH